MTGNSIINAALRMLGVIGEGETPSASESTDALAALNAMIDSWNVDRLNLYTSAVNSFSLVSATTLYTIGATGSTSWVMTRPVKVDAVIVVIGDNSAGTPATHKVRRVVEMIGVDEWVRIASQTAKNTFPEKVYIDEAFPNRNARFWPEPLFSGGTTPLIEIWSWTILAAFANLTTDYTFPPGYEMVFKANLALILAPEYNRAASADVLRLASESKGALRNINAASLPASMQSSPQSGT